MQNFFVRKISRLSGLLSKLVQANHRWGPESKTLAAGIFRKKNNYFNAIWVTFCTFLQPRKRTKLLKSEVICKKITINPHPPFFTLQPNSKTCFNAGIFKSNCLGNLANFSYSPPSLVAPQATSYAQF